MNETSTVILRDGEGGFYLLTPELLAQARATPEEQAQLSAQIEEQDVRGYDGTTQVSFALVTLGMRKAGGDPTSAGKPF